MPRYKLTIEYDGADYAGWQRQENGASIQQALDLGVTAEGIETEAQRAFLDRAGCASGQGYLFARPLNSDDVRARLQANPPPERIVA